MCFKVDGVQNGYLPSCCFAHKKMRLEKNMTIDDLAEKCDVSTQTIKLIEAGRRNFINPKLCIQ